MYTGSKFNKDWVVRKSNDHGVFIYCIVNHTHILFWLFKLEVTSNYSNKFNYNNKEFNNKILSHDNINI